MKKNGEIEVLRFILALAVCLCHFRGYGNWQCMRAGYLAVDFFFVISGFFLAQKVKMARMQSGSDERKLYIYITGVVNYSHTISFLGA